MVELKICSLDEAEGLGRAWATRVLSLIDPDQPFPRLGPHHLLLRVDDVVAAAPDRIACTGRHIAAALALADALVPEDRLLVHCHAGTSRSPAMASVILAAHGLSADAAMARVAAVRPRAQPNRLIVRLGDEALGLGGALVEAAEAQWRRALASDMDRLIAEEMEREIAAARALSPR